MAKTCVRGASIHSMTLFLFVSKWETCWLNWSGTAASIQSASQPPSTNIYIFFLFFLFRIIFSHFGMSSLMYVLLHSLLITIFLHFCFIFFFFVANWDLFRFTNLFYKILTLEFILGFRRLFSEIMWLYAGFALVSAIGGYFFCFGRFDAIDFNRKFLLCWQDGCFIYYFLLFSDIQTDWQTEATLTWNFTQRRTFDFDFIYCY